MLTNICNKKDSKDYAIQGRGSSTTSLHFGSDINRSFADKKPSTYYGNEFLQGIRTKTTYTDVTVVYIINPRSDFHIELGY